MRVFDFECADGHVHELFVKNDQTEVACPTCGAPAAKKLSAPTFKLEGTTGDFPGAAMKWERKRAQKLAAEQKKMQDHGTYN